MTYHEKQQLNPYLRKVNARTATRQDWKNAPAWVRRQSCYFLDTPGGGRAFVLAIVAKYRGRRDYPLCRLYLDNLRQDHAEASA